MVRCGTIARLRDACSQFRSKLARADSVPSDPGCAPMARDVVVIGASTGGLEAVRKIIGNLPAGLSAAVFVVIHTPPDNPGALPLILSKAGVLPAQHARHG